MHIRLEPAALSSARTRRVTCAVGIDAVLTVLHQALGRPGVPIGSSRAIDPGRGRQLPSAHTDALLGALPGERGLAIMVTMLSKAADDSSSAGVARNNHLRHARLRHHCRMGRCGC
jgi:hypothetical protein